MRRIAIPLIAALCTLAALPRPAEAGWRRGGWVAPPVGAGPPVVSYAPICVPPHWDAWRR